LKRPNNLRSPKIHRQPRNGTVKKPVLSHVEGPVPNWAERPLPHNDSFLLAFFLIVVSLSAGCQAEAPVEDPQRVTSRLATLLLEEPSRDVRRTAALSLGKIGHVAATTALVKALSDPDLQVREYSAWALGQIGEDVNDKAAVRLAGMLADRDRSVKQAAAQALGKIGPRQQVIAILTQVLAVGERGSRRAAVDALAQLEAKSAYPALREALIDQDPAVRQGALAALGELGDRRALPDFRERLLFDTDPGVRAEAAYRLGKLGDHRELQALEEAAHDDASPFVRVWADRAKAGIGPGPTGGEGDTEE